MRYLDNMTPQEIETLALKGMTAPRTASERAQCDHNEMVRDPVGKYGYWMCAKCFRPYGKPNEAAQ